MKIKKIDFLTWVAKVYFQKIENELLENNIDIAVHALKICHRLKQMVLKQTIFKKKFSK